MNVVVESIGYYIPPERRDNYLYCSKFGIGEDFIDSKIGVRYLPYKKEEQETSDLAYFAIQDLIRKTSLQLDGVDGLILCTQNPDGFGLPHTSAILHGKLNLSPNCAAFDVSLGCSGYVYGLSIADAMMKTYRLKTVILVTADPYSKIVDKNDKNTCLLFGDGATATLLRLSESKATGWALKKVLFGTDGSQSSALYTDNTRRLKMDGRGVFNFSATVVPSQIKKLLEQSGLVIEDIDIFLFHQGSKYIIDSLRKRLGIDEEKAPCNIAKTGNTVSSSIPLLLKDYLQLQKGSKALISGFGVGLSYASAILEME